MTNFIPREIRERAEPAKELKNEILAAGARVQFFKRREGNVRQSLYINNLSAHRIYLKSSDSPTAKKITIRPNSDLYFEPHEVLYAQTEHPDVLQVVVHCDWTEDVWLENAGASDAEIEAYEGF